MYLNKEDDHTEREVSGLHQLFHSPCTVLLAEEDDDLREELSLGLAREGYRVVAVEDGLELRDYVELATSHRGRPPLPDVVVADAELAGLDGLEACAMVRRHCQARCVLLAARRDADTLRRALEAGISETLVKPVAADELSELVGLLWR